MTVMRILVLYHTGSTPGITLHVGIKHMLSQTLSWSRRIIESRVRKGINLCLTAFLYDQFLTIREWRCKDVDQVLLNILSFPAVLNFVLQSIRTTQLPFETCVPSGTDNSSDELESCSLICPLRQKN